MGGDTRRGKICKTEYRVDRYKRNTYWLDTEEWRKFCHKTAHPTGNV